MNFKPLSEEDVSSATVLKAGEYDFEILAAKETLSKAGNEMIIVTLKVVDGKSRTFIINDFLLNDERFLYKLRHIAYAVGIGADYEKGCIIPEYLLGKRGRVRTKIETDKSGANSPRAVAQDYLPKDPQEEMVSFVDDDLAF